MAMWNFAYPQTGTPSHRLTVSPSHSLTLWPSRGFPPRPFLFPPTAPSAARTLPTVQWDRGRGHHEKTPCFPPLPSLSCSMPSYAVRGVLFTVCAALCTLSLWRETLGAHHSSPAVWHVRCTWYAYNSKFLFGASCLGWKRGFRFRSLALNMDK